MNTNDIINCVREHLDKWYASNNHNETAIQLVNEYEEKTRADERRKFADKIKSHLTMYCFARLEQQYCAMEVIGYIGKLLGEKDYSIDVEKEIAKHDEQIRTDERKKIATKCKYFLGSGDGKKKSLECLIRFLEKEQKQ